MSLFAQPSALVLLIVLPALWLLGRHALRLRRKSWCNSEIQRCWL